MKPENAMGQVVNAMLEYRISILRRAAEAVCSSCADGTPRVDRNWHMPAGGSVRIECRATPIYDLIKEANDQVNEYNQSRYIHTQNATQRDTQVSRR